jgi:lipoyl-dependent peroxiredoxin
MTETSKIVHTARTRTTGGREHGTSRSSDGRLDVRLAAPGADRIGTNPEQLFAAAWSASLQAAIELAAQRTKIALPAGIVIDAEVDLNIAQDGDFLSARFNVRLPGVERAAAESLIDEARRTCPYARATEGNVNIAIMLLT